MKKLDPTPLVIYHGNCADGFTAAWLLNIAEWQELYPLLSTLRPSDWVIDHHAGVYNEPPPDVKDRLVYVLDFSYKPEVMMAMAESAALVIWIDHHSSAIDAMKGFEHPRLAAHTSIERSGAYLTSKHLWPDREPMDMVKLVDDRDRWVFADRRSRPFAAGLFSRPYKIGEWNHASENVAQLVKDGEVIDRSNLKSINELLDVMTIWSDVCGFRVPTANLSYISASDACNQMLIRHPEAPFAASWYLRKDKKQVFSLRSRTGSDVDVGALAKEMGGGGHKHAAAFAV